MTATKPGFRVPFRVNASGSGGCSSPTEYDTVGNAYRGVASVDEEVSISWDAGLGVAAGNYTGRIQNDDGSLNLDALKSFMRIGTVDDYFGADSLWQVYSNVGDAAFTMNPEGSITMNATQVNLTSSGQIWDGYAYNELGIYLDVETSQIASINVIATAFESVQFGRPRRVGLLMSSPAQRSFGWYGGDSGGTVLSFMSKEVPNSFGSSINFSINDIGGTGDYLLEASSIGAEGSIAFSAAYNRHVGAAKSAVGNSIGNPQGDPDERYFVNGEPYKFYYTLWSNESVDEPWSHTWKAVQLQLLPKGLS